MVREAGIEPRVALCALGPRNCLFWDAHQAGHDARRPGEHLSHPCLSFYSAGVARSGPVPVSQVILPKAYLEKFPSQIFPISRPS